MIKSNALSGFYKLIVKFFQLPELSPITFTQGVDE